MDIFKEIAQNASMGIKAINSIRSYVEDEELMHRVLCHREDLKIIKSEADENIEEPEDKKPSKIQEAMLKTGVFMNTLFNKSNDNIARMLIEGNNMGMNSLQKSINSMQQENQEVPPLAQELMSAYQHSIDELRTFL